MKPWMSQHELSYRSKLSEGISFPQALLQLVHHSVWEKVGLSYSAASLPTPEYSQKQGPVDRINHYHEWTVRGKHGYIRCDFDGIRIIIEAFVTPDRKNGVKIFRGALRDRQKDGTGVKDHAHTPCNSFPNDDPAYSRPLPETHVAELSIYSWEPETMLPNMNEPNTVGHFIAEPDYYTWGENFNWHKWECYFKLWKEAVELDRSPWQRGLPMKGVPQHFVMEAAKLLTELGYDAIDEVASWFNVVAFFLKMGYQFTFGEHALIYRELERLLQRHFPGLSVHQQPWLVALQNIPSSYIPDALRLSLNGDPNLILRYPCTHTNEVWPRMHLPLNNYECHWSRTKIATDLYGPANDRCIVFMPKEDLPFLEKITSRKSSAD